MNETTVTMTGNVVGDPVVRTTKRGGTFVTFRLASTTRRFNAAEGRYVDSGTSFVDVSAFRQLGQNISLSVSKGQPVVVTGRLRVNEWHKDERRGVSVSIDASAVGHDLSRGCTRFLKVRPGHEGEGSNPVRLPDESHLHALVGVSSEPEAWEPTEPDYPEYDDVVRDDLGPDDADQDAAEPMGA